MSVLDIAHRGASFDAPENTLAAFELAVEQGADMIETDVHLLRDGEIGIYHDDAVDGSPLAELSLAELRERRPDAPTLVEALDAVGEIIPFNLEIKRPRRARYAGLEKQVLDLVRARGLLERTLFSCFGDDVLRVLRRTALDELPQVLSIWKGDMSLVGPRALPVPEQKLLEGDIPGFDDRLTGILPGLTGLSQIYNRTDSAPGKLNRDLEYRHRMSPWLDVKLLFLSVWRTVTVRWDSRSAKPKGEGTEVDSGPDSPGDPAGTQE